MRAESKVGLVVLAFIVMVVYFSFKIGGNRLPWQEDEGYRIAVVFDTVSGLETKSIVRYAGVEVGSVDSIELVDGKARVTLRLEPGVQVKRDASIEVGSMGLMGEKYVLIKGGSPEAPWVEEGAVIMGRSAISMDELVASLGAIGDDFKAISASLREAIGADDGRNRVADIMVNIDRLTASLADLTQANDRKLTQVITNFQFITDDLRQIIHDNRNDLSGTVTNLHTVAEALARTMPSISGDLQLIMNDLRQIIQANESAVSRTMQNIADASGELDQTLVTLRNVTEKIDRGEGSIGKLINDPQLHDNLNAAITEIDETAKGLQKFLGRTADYRLVFGYRGEYLSSYDGTRSYVSLRIQPRPDKFYLVELVDSPYGKYFEREYQYEFESNELFPEDLSFTEKYWDQNQLTYNVQYGKIFDHLAIRFGLIESTAGLAMDYALFNNRLQFSMEGWDFSRDSDPHLKIGGQWNLTPNFFLSGGWDDFLLQKDDLDSVYFGAGLRIEDEDLKLLLGFLPMVNN
ncbi:MCE family protein [bacterium]|nr:MCE family protein [candidate division CSSED10-310 bacterium]